MKILVLQSELGVLRGGGENFTRNLFSVLARRGHQVSASFVAAPGKRYPLELPPGFTPVPLSGLWVRKPGQGALSFVGRFLAPESRAGLFLGRVKDALDWRSGGWHDGRFRRRALQAFNGRWTDFDAVYVHSNVALASTIGKIVPTILRLPGPVSPDVAPLLSTIPVVCANGDALLRLRAILSHEKIVELPVGLDGTMFAPDRARGRKLRAEHGWTDENKIIGYVGRFTRLKGVDLLVDAFRSIVQHTPEARLVMIGHGEEEESIRHHLASQVSDGTVRIVPGLDGADLAPWYSAMDLFVLPSRYENFSNALLEALACGLPCVASGVGGNSILGREGVFEPFEPGSSTDLARAIHRSLQDIESRRTRALNMSGRIRGAYSWENSADHLERICESYFHLSSARAFDGEEVMP